MILQMARASPLPFAELAILSAMSKTDAHILDPIPDAQYLEAPHATGATPAGVRFLASHTIIDIDAYGDAGYTKILFYGVDTAVLGVLAAVWAIAQAKKVAKRNAAAANAA